MSLWDRVKVRLGLADDYDEDYDDEYYDEDEDEDYKPPPRRSYNEPLSVRRVSREPDIQRAREATPLRSVDRDYRDQGYERHPEPAPQVHMHLTEPKSFSEAQAIADRFKTGTPVIMNLTGTNAELSKRLIDFASGLTYGLDGGLRKVADKVFMLTPANVDVSAEDRRRLKDKGLFTLDG